MTNLRSTSRREPPQEQTQPRLTREEARQFWGGSRKLPARLDPGPALAALRLAESALAIKASLRVPEQAMVNRALETVRETLALYREANHA